MLHSEISLAEPLRTTTCHPASGGRIGSKPTLKISIQRRIFPRQGYRAGVWPPLLPIIGIRVIEIPRMTSVDCW